MPKTTRRVMGNPGKGAFDIWERALALEAQGREIIHLEIGEPDTSAPPHVLTALKEALDSGRTRYEKAHGTSGLRQAIAAYLQNTRGELIDPFQIVVGPGVKGMMFVAAQALLEAGDELLVPDPGYPFYQSINQYTGSRAVPYPLRPEDGFQPDFEVLRSKITPDTRAILINSPGNPSGAIFDGSTLAKIGQLAVDHDLWILADEIYAQLYFTDGFPPSIYSVSGMAERTILFDGCSKAYSMTGWRVGFGVFPPALVPAIVTLLSHTVSCLPPFVMDAAEAAYRGPQDGVAGLRNLYRRRRDYVMERLAKMPGVSAGEPAGSFYIMIDVNKLVDGDSRPLAHALLENGVAVLPGEGLGERGRGFFRIALTRPIEELSRAFDTLEETINRFFQSRQSADSNSHFSSNRKVA